MRISFDLDDTLVCRDPKVPHERDILAWILKFLFPDPLRFGTIALIKKLNELGCSIWIYTTSNRSPKYVRFWLMLYGIKVEGVVNSEIHQRMIECGMSPKDASKYPPAFSIDLHVDDSEGVKLEGEKHGFAVVQVMPNQHNWIELVLEKVEQQLKISGQ